MQLAHSVRTGQISTLKLLWSKTSQWINNARISQYRTISNCYHMRANKYRCVPCVPCTAGFCLCAAVRTREEEPYHAVVLAFIPGHTLKSC